MTTGPNYGQAKQLLGMAHHWSYGDGGDANVGGALATEALAHAVLALVDVLTEAQAKQAAHNADTTDPATEAFVDVADAERYALRDEYVNSVDAERTTLAEQLRAVGAEQAARVVEGAPACARCKVPFDPEDKSYTGSAQHDDTPYCMGCVDNCHEAGADHRCIICAPRVAESGS